MRSVTILLLIGLLAVSTLAANAAERSRPDEQPAAARSAADEAIPTTDERAAGEQELAQEPLCFGRRATIDDRRGQIAPTAGSDVIVGNDGRNQVDLFEAGDRGGVDRVCSGDGNDEIDYRDASDPSGGVLFAKGEGGKDTLLGTDGDDQLFGGAGNDSLGGFRGRNVLSGGDGNDFLASSGPDRLEGGPGNDDLRADNELTGESGVDTVNGGDGNDDIFAQDGRRDDIDCGPGRDTAFIDPGIDKVTGCEQVSPDV